MYKTTRNVRGMQNPWIISLHPIFPEYSAEILQSIDPSQFLESHLPLYSFDRFGSCFKKENRFNICKRIIKIVYSESNIRS